MATRCQLSRVSHVVVRCVRRQGIPREWSGRVQTPGPNAGERVEQKGTGGNRIIDSP
jgi:hypothetical protein